MKAFVESSVPALHCWVFFRDKVAMDFSANRRVTWKQPRSSINQVRLLQPTQRNKKLNNPHRLLEDKATLLALFGINFCALLKPSSGEPAQQYWELYGDTRGHLLTYPTHKDMFARVKLSAFYLNKTRRGEIGAHQTVNFRRSVSWPGPAGHSESFPSCGLRAAPSEGRGSRASGDAAPTPTLPNCSWQAADRLVSFAAYAGDSGWLRRNDKNRTARGGGTSDTVRHGQWDLQLAQVTAFTTRGRGPSLHTSSCQGLWAKMMFQTFQKWIEINE